MAGWPHGSGEMVERVRAHDWASTPLGPIESWPEGLKAVVQLMLSSPLVSSVALTADRLLLYNDAAALLYGTRHPGALGRPLPETFYDSYPTVAPLYDRVFAGESVQVHAQPLAVGTGEGNEVFDAYLSPVWAADSTIIGAHMVGMEIGSSARAEAALRKSEQRLKRVLETEAVAVLFFTHDGVLTDANDVFLRMTGYTREDVETHQLTWQQMTPSEYHAESQAQMDQFLIDGRIGPYEKEYLRKDGSRAWMLFAGRDLGDGTIVEFGVEITDRKRAEEALRDSERRLRLALDSAQMGTFLYHVGEDRGEPDKRMLTLFGLPENATLNLSEALTRLIHPDDRAAYAEAVARSIEPGSEGRLRKEIRVIHPDGSLHWIDVSAETFFEDIPRRPSVMLGMAFDITERKRGEQALRASKERQAFLLKLSDALRPLADGADIQSATTRLLGEHLGLDRCYYFETDHQTGEYVIRRDFVRGNLRSLVGRHPVQQWPQMTAALSRGEMLVVDDFAHSPHIPPEERPPTEGLDIRAIILIPLVKRGRLVACMAAIQAVSREWKSGEVSLVTDVAERTWAAVERGRAEAALRESEERFRQFANASAGGIWIRDAATLAMEYASPAIGTIYGVEPGAIGGDIQKWAAMILPEDRTGALEHIEQARHGESVVHEFRIQRPSDQVFRWVRDTDFPLYDDGHVQRIGGIAEDVTEEKLAIEHQGVLLAELQHRVRNIMAIIRSIASRTADGADRIEDYVELLSGRLLTLARVQVLLTRAANAGVGIVAIVHDELSAQASHASQFDVSGPAVLLSPKAAETMTLAVHELTTNALKYGALSTEEGKVTVRWAVVDKRGAPWLTFDWTETGASGALRQPRASGPRRVGFGSELIERRIPYELSGRGKVTIDTEGAQCHLEFPLKGGASVLETEAPRRVEVFGGAIDMAGAADLSGQRILVVEDDYYLANDTARALKGAGAEVIGPCPNEDAARDAIANLLPTGAILDINLNGGRSFTFARELKERGVPFVFFTGYDQEVIPTEFEAVIRLQKPVEFRRIIEALADSLAIKR